MFFTLLFVGAIGQTPLPLLPENSYRNTYLIRGVVVEQRESSAYTINQIRIDHVYHGPMNLLAQTFAAYSAERQPEGSVYPHILIPKLRIGEVVISAITKHEVELLALDNYNYSHWPIRERGNPNWMPSYETIETFAQAVERVSRLSNEVEAIATLQDLATDANTYVSSWAISRLPAVSQGAAEVSQFLEEVVDNEDVPIQGQVELDRVLLGTAKGSSAHNPNRAWQKSQARLGLFQRWFAGALSERDADLVVTRLDLITQHPDKVGLPQDDLLRLVELLATNDKFPLRERQRVTIIMAWAAQRYENGDAKVFDTAVALVSSDLPEELRGSIAGVIVHRVTLDDRRRAVLTKLRDAEKSPSVAKVLDKALARPNGKPKRN